MKKTIIVVLVVCVLAGAGLAVFFLMPESDIFSRFGREKTFLSSQQEELVGNLGYPTSYTLAFGEMIIDEEFKDVRFEAWHYDRHGRTFYFVDGEFKKDVDIDFISEADPFPITPDKFKKDMTFEEIKKVLNAEPTVSAEVPDLLMENAIAYDFADQMKVATKDNIVIYIEALPIQLTN